MPMRVLGCLVALLFITLTGFAQYKPKTELDLEQFARQLFQVQSQDLNYEDLYETLLQYYRQPLNLNLAGFEELNALHILSVAQINALLKYRAQYGALLSVYELQAVPALDLPTIYNLLYFATIPEANPQTSLADQLLAADNHELFVRTERNLPLRRGFMPAQQNDSNRYLGSADKLYVRYRLNQPKKFSIGFTAEKDAGEQIIFDTRTKRYGADFYSYHAQVYSKGFFKTLALGDYQVQFGQGLVAASGFSFGKGSETITTLRRSHLGIRPYTSVLEAGFFRGAAFTLQRHQVEFTGFYSSRKIDAALQTADTLVSNDFYFGAEQLSGYHRTTNELAHKANTGRQDAGFNLSYVSETQHLRIGTTFLHTRYQHTLQKRNQPYNAFEFSGKTNTIGGLHYSYNWQNFAFFGETANSGPKGWGTVNGLVASLHPLLDVGLMYRSYAPGFHSLYGRAFGENYRNSNEEGIYWSVKLRPKPDWELSAYLDQFRFPWIKYQVNAPSAGRDILLHAAYTPNKTVALHLQYLNSNKPANQPDSLGVLNAITQTQRHQYVFKLNYAPARGLAYRAGVQGTLQQRQAYLQGFATWQELTLHVMKVRLTALFALFDTDSYAVRQYLFEKDVLYAFSIPALSGRGSRYYLLLQAPLNKHVDVWLKYAVTQYAGKTTIGTGLEQVSGNTTSTVKMQVRYKF